MQKIQKQIKLFTGHINITEICYLNFSKKCKINYYNQYFKANMNNIKNTWLTGINLLKLLKIYILIFQRIYLPMDGSTINNKPSKNFRCLS